MYYRHNLDYKYPERSDEHMIEVKHVRDTNFDVNYPYLDKSFLFKVKRVIYWTLVNAIVFPLMRLTHGLRISERIILRSTRQRLRAERSPFPITCSSGTILPS